MIILSYTLEKPVPSIHKYNFLCTNLIIPFKEDLEVKYPDQ